MTSLTRVTFPSVETTAEGVDRPGTKWGNSGEDDENSTRPTNEQGVLGFDDPVWIAAQELWTSSDVDEWIEGLATSVEMSRQTFGQSSASLNNRITGRAGQTPASALM